VLEFNGFNALIFPL